MYLVTARISNLGLARRGERWSLSWKEQRYVVKKVQKGLESAAGFCFLERSVCAEEKEVRRNVKGKLIRSGLSQQKTLGRFRSGSVKAVVKYIDAPVLILIRWFGEVCICYCYLFALLLLFCFRRCCHLFFPKDKYLYFILYQISELMQCLHVLPNKSRSERSRWKWEFVN